MVLSSCLHELQDVNLQVVKVLAFDLRACAWCTSCSVVEQILEKLTLFSWTEFTGCTTGKMYFVTFFHYGNPARCIFYS